MDTIRRRSTATARRRTGGGRDALAGVLVVLLAGGAVLAGPAALAVADDGVVASAPSGSSIGVPTGVSAAVSTGQADEADAETPTEEPVGRPAEGAAEAPSAVSTEAPEPVADDRPAPSTDPAPVQRAGAPYSLDLPGDQTRVDGRTLTVSGTAPLGGRIEVFDALDRRRLVHAVTEESFTFSVSLDDSDTYAQHLRFYAYGPDGASLGVVERALFFTPLPAPARPTVRTDLGQPVVVAPDEPGDFTFGRFDLTGTGVPGASVELQAVTGDGQTLYLNAGFAPVVDGGGRWSGTVSIPTESLRLVVAQYLVDERGNPVSEFAVVEYPFVAVPDLAAATISSPTTGAVLARPRTMTGTSPLVVSGTGTPGSNVIVQVGTGDDALDDENALEGGTVPVDGAGRWSVSSALATGTFRLRAVAVVESAAGPVRVIGDEIAVTIPPAAVPAAVAASLAYTGTADSTPWACLAGMVLVGLGAATVFVTRRRASRG